MDAKIDFYVWHGPKKWSKYHLDTIQTTKDTIYTKLALMAWLDDKLGHAPAVLVIIAKVLYTFTNFPPLEYISSVAQLVEQWPHELGVVGSIPHQGKNLFLFLIQLKWIFKLKVS